MNTVLIQLYSFLGISVISTSLLIIVLMLGGVQPIKALITAKVKRATLVLLGRNDGSFELLSGVYAHGVQSTKRGSFIITPKSTHHFYGRRLALATEQTSFTIPKKVEEYIEELQEEGILDIENAEKAKHRLERLSKKGKLNATDSKLLSNLTSVIHFFKYSANPAQIADKEAAMQELTAKKDVRNYLLIGGGVTMVILALCLGFYIVSNFMKCPSCPSFSQLCNTAQAAAEVVAPSGVLGGMGII